MGIALDYNLHRVSVDIAKGFRQFQKSDAAFDDDNFDRSVKYLNKGLDCFATAGDHIAKAEDDAYNEAGDEIAKGNKELQKSIDAYADDNVDRAQNDYASALNYYDKALDLID